jgi:nitroreductase
MATTRVAVAQNHGMDLIDAMRTTASVRAFIDEPVDDATLHRILDSARFAPSGGNQQAWHVIAVKDPANRRVIRDLVSEVWTEYVSIMRAGFRPFSVGADGRFHGHPIDLAEARKHPIPGGVVDTVETAPALLVVTVKLTALAMVDIELDREHFIAGGSIYPFCHNILLAARNEGIGGVLTTFLARKEPETKALLGIPEDHAVAAMLVLGHPVAQVTKLTRHPVESFATIDRFDGPAVAALRR